ncbi:nodulation protein NfeD, partial [Vibrio fluvialis]|nr:nodulation protein NfeD [Vibrio fluvialis]
ATPVQIGGPSPGGGEQQDKPSEPTAMEKKVLNDSIAYIRSLAQLRGRNVEWAEKAVRDAATLSAIEALEMNVINVMAESPQDLLNAVNGQTLDVNHRAVSLNVDKAQLEIREPDLRNQFLATITDPNVAYILMMIGVYGLLLEFYTPSFGIAGITGAISLLIALYAFQLLPVNYVGMGLMLLGIALFIAESFLPSFGLLGIGGIVAFVLGSVFLIDSDLPELQVSLGLIYSIAAVSAALIIFVLSRVMELRRKQVVSGQEAMLGMEGMALDSFEGQGFVHVDGERWEALSDV